MNTYLKFHIDNIYHLLLFVNMSLLYLQRAFLLSECFPIFF